MMPMPAHGLLALFAVLAPLPSGQFRSQVEAVQVDVFVARGNRAVLDLAANDFELYDNDVRQSIERIETKQLPVNVVVALDRSFSVRGDKLEYLKSGVRAFIENLEPNDGAALLSFSSLVDWRPAFEGSLDPLLEELEHVESGGYTSLADGMFAAVKLVEGLEHPMILVFTDGEDRFSWLTGAETIATVMRSEAPIFAVTTGREPESTGASRAFLGELTELSGGELYVTRSPAELSTIFLKILAQMKTRYVLTYFPAEEPAPGWHSLKVRLKKGRAEVRARRGYYYVPRSR